MANSMSLQEVLAVFERFGEVIQLGGEDGRAWLCLGCTQAGIRIEGNISYPYESPEPGFHFGDASVSLNADGQSVFLERYYRSGKGEPGGSGIPIFFPIELLVHALSSKYEYSPDMLRVVNFIRKFDKPLREVQNRRIRDIHEEVQREVQRETGVAAERLRKFMR